MHIWYIGIEYGYAVGAGTLGSIDTTVFNFWGIPPYLFCACIATVVAVCVFIVLLSAKNFPIDPYLKSLGIAVIGLVVAARLFGCASGVFGAIGRQERIQWKTITNTGIVFYGGLTGLLTTYWCIVKSKKFGVCRSSMDLLAVVIPLFHAISRVGCFFGGCCYGLIYGGPLSVNYTTEVQGEIVAGLRFPVQLLESILNLGLFIYLMCLVQKDDWTERNILKKYLFIYSIQRFFLEFLRGDIHRGVIAGVSFSQVYSLSILAVLIASYRKEKRKEKEIVYESG